ncbi:ROK family protein [Salinirubellus salinus]|uniref:ROK family protein n=1 Tax=Salinirubellus salinus TaxID=1364945 RepID=A0A9E7UBM1_9EURY|nr:ROK family protein [Salinirubellus salinus]UWM55338.1 ROK family protein [Salinirubellus salinus]
MTDARYAGIDVGATNTRAVVADASGSLVGRARRRTPQADGPTITEAIVWTLREACDDAALDPHALTAVGVGTLGPLDTDAGAVVGPPNLPADRFELVDPLVEATGAEVRLRNDAVAGVVGERRFTDAPENTVYLTLSSGVGAGACVDGNVLSGWQGNAAEMGHVVVDSEGTLTCGCGGAGHWEAYAGGENIPTYARHLHATEGLDTDLDLDSLDAAGVFAADERGDPLGEAVVDRLVRWNTHGVATLVHAFAPEVVSLGGAVALENSERVVDPVRERLPDLLATAPPTVRVTTLGEDVVVRGALALVLPGSDETR